MKQFDEYLEIGLCKNCHSRPLNYDGFCRAYSTIPEYEELNDCSVLCEKFSQVREIKCGNCQNFNNDGDYNCDAADCGLLDLEIDEPVTADNKLAWCECFRAKAVF